MAPSKLTFVFVQWNQCADPSVLLTTAGACCGCASLHVRGTKLTHGSSAFIRRHTAEMKSSEELQTEREEMERPCERHTLSESVSPLCPKV